MPWKNLAKSYIIVKGEQTILPSKKTALLANWAKQEPSQAEGGWLSGESDWRETGFSLFVKETLDQLGQANQNCILQRENLLTAIS